MKKLLFLLLLFLFGQCKDPKNDCGVVTQKIGLNADSKSGAATCSASVSYNPFEYIVVLPQGKDSLAAIQTLKKAGWELVKTSKINPNVHLVRHGPVSGPRDTTQVPPKNPPPPPDPFFRVPNTYIINARGNPVPVSDMMDDIMDKALNIRQQ